MKGGLGERDVLPDPMAIEGAVRELLFIAGLLLVPLVEDKFRDSCRHNFLYRQHSSHSLRYHPQVGEAKRSRRRPYLTRAIAANIEKVHKES